MASGTRIVSVVGKKDSGKTTVIVAIARELTRKGRRVATIKHGTHSADIDRQGSDTWRHYNEGHAERVLIEGPGGRAYFERTEDEDTPVSLARRYMDGTDIVLVEGFTKHPIPKIEVHRKAKHDEPIYDPSHPHADQWLAMLSDDPTLQMHFPVFLFTDTEWLISLTGIVWDYAAPIDS